MFFVRMTVYKTKDDRQSSVEVPAFFRHDETIQEVQEYIAEKFRDVATCYIEYLEDPEQQVDVAL